MLCLALWIQAFKSAFGKDCYASLWPGLRVLQVLRRSAGLQIAVTENKKTRKIDTLWYIQTYFYSNVLFIHVVLILTSRKNEEHI